MSLEVFYKIVDNILPLYEKFPYHNAKHIEYCIHNAMHHDLFLPRRGEVVLALLFHDIIYGRAEAEEASADFAGYWLRDNIKEELDLPYIKELIKSTKDHLDPNPIEDINKAVMLDCDLAILGTPLTTVYDEYAYSVKIEYTSYLNIPADRYKEGRKQFLIKMLQKPIIYKSEYFGTKLEYYARLNLMRELRSLQC